jgi:hypothetical protein
VSTDLHDLDKFIGRYVAISEGPEGAAGWLVNVSDHVKYDGSPHRWVTLDWGQGWPVRETTEITLEEPPAGEKAPRVENPIQVIHQQMDGKSCSGTNCPNAVRAANAMRALRAWQARQADQYWVHHYAKRMDSLRGDPVSITELLRDARGEGAPPHIMDRLESLSTAHVGG